MDIKLISVSPKGTRKEFPLSASVVTLGRQMDCDLKVPLVKISRQHCQLRIEDDKISIRDMDSANGTFVNGQKVTEQELHAGDVISLADAVNFLIQVDGQPASIDEAKLRPGSAPAVTALKSPPSKAKPAAPGASVAVKPASKIQEDETDDILGDSFFKDMDDDEEDTK